MVSGDCQNNIAIMLLIPWYGKTEGTFQFHLYTSHQKDRPRREPRALIINMCAVLQEWPNISVSTIDIMNALKAVSIMT